MNIIENIDQKLWKEIQDKFSEVTGLHLITVDLEGNVISESGNYPFFCDLMRKSEEGSSRCKDCQNKFLDISVMENRKISFHKCHAGLTYILSPIVVKGRVTGAVMVPSLRSKENSIHLSRIAEEVSLEGFELIDSFKNIQQVSKEDMIKLGSLMYTLSQTIPIAVHEKHMVSKKVNQLMALQKISSKLVSTLDLNQIIKYVLESINENFQMESSVVLFQDKKKEKYSLGKGEITSEENEAAIQVLMNNRGAIVSKEDKEEHILSLPLIVGTEIVGVLNIFGSDKELLRENAEIFNIICDLSASSIVNCRQFEEINRLAITDKLTGLYNRKYFNDSFEMELKKMSRSGEPISLMIFDLDHFGKYNNEFGHPEGDVLLEVFSKMLKDNFRETDIVARYGGEEFVALLPNTYSKEAIAIAERVRQNLEKTEFLRVVTTSIGIACCLDKNSNQRKIIKAADEALYKSKNNGRNRTSLSEILGEGEIKEISDLDSYVY